MSPPLPTAAQRFWHGVREPWILLGQMRAHPPLWRRYWRIVLTQVAVTLVAGAVVFWVGKGGVDVWRDAFGSDAPLPEVAAATSTAPGTAAPPTSSDSPPAPARPERGGGAGARTKRAAAKAAAVKPPGPPMPPPPAARPGDTGPGVSAAPPPPTRPVDPDDEEDEDAEKPEATSDADDAAVEAEFQAAQDKIAKAPAGEKMRAAGQALERGLARVKEATEKANRRREKTPKPPKDPEQTRREEIAEQTEDLNDSVEELAAGAHALATHPPPDYRKAHRTRLDLEEKIGEVESAVRKLQGLGGPGLSAAQAAQLLTARTDLLAARAHEKDLSGRIGAIIGFLAVVYASLSIAQAGVLAMSRDFHDVLSRELSLLVQVAPEDPPMVPRIRLDVPWVRRKTNRRVQFFLGFLPGTAMIWLVGRFVPYRNVFVSTLTTVWAAYWWLVMTAGQSARAWTPPETTSPPWYIRGWQRLTTKVFLFRWGLPRAWGRLWERMSRRFNGPSERVEEQPMEFAGLALSRALALFPLTKLLVRPLFPVAAARLLVEHASTARLPVPVTAAELIRAAEVSPDPDARAHSGTVAWPPPGGDRVRERS